MIAPGLPIEEIAEDHLRALISDGFSERRTIEYKRQLPGGTDDGKREFLADVSSLANASGGDLIFGIVTEDGVPIDVAPLAITPDSERLRWEQAIRDGIQPRIPGVRLQEIPVTGGHVMLVRVPKSWLGPHVVSYKNWSRFFSRTSAGKCQLDVGELRDAFLAGSVLGDQIREFRRERIGLILVGDAPIPLPAGPKVVVHFIPYEAFTTQPVLELNAHAGSGLFKPIFQQSGGMGERWNLDGFLTYDTDQSEERVTVYSQLFRNGIFEGVDTRVLRPRMRSQDEGQVLYAYWLERALNEGLANPLEVLRRIGVRPPLLILVSVVGAQNYNLLSGDALRDIDGWRRIDRDVLMLPDVVIGDFEIEYRDGLPRLLRPVVDAFWQSGRLGSLPELRRRGQLENQELTETTVGVGGRLTGDGRGSPKSPPCREGRSRS
jgi:Schlafen, AlbA_2